MKAEEVTPSHRGQSLGLNLPQGLSKNDWSAQITALLKDARRTYRHGDSLVACIGDLLAYNEGKYHGQISDYAEAAGLAAGTLRDAKMVCLRIPLSCRRDTLSWAHHVEIGKAYTDLVQINAWLDRAEREKLSRKNLRQLICLGKSKKHQAPSPSAQNHSVNAFALLRELRASVRQIMSQSDLWRSWSPATCQSILNDIGPLAHFIDQMRLTAVRRSDEPQAN
jgi:hypothetical protein